MTEHRWCTECGAEHEAWAPQCAFCGAAIVDAPPDPPATVQRGTVLRDVSDLGVEQLSELQFLLQVNEVRHDLRAGFLEVAQAEEAVVDDLLAAARDDVPAVDGELLVATAEASTTAGAAPPNGCAPARARTRFLSFVLGVLAWTVMWSVVAIVSEYVAPSATSGILRWELVALVPVSVLLTRTGVSPGELFLRLRVAAPDDSRPAWGPSAVRSVVLWGPFVALNEVAVLVGRTAEAAGWLALAAQLWLVLVGVSVVVGPDGAGWHDRAAGTQVLRRPAAGAVT